VAFFADFDSGPFGIFAGPDVVADTVTGDVLFGSAVKTLSFEEPGDRPRLFPLIVLIVVCPAYLCQHLVKAAQQWNLRLRQNYNRLALRLLRQIRRYASARQYKRMHRLLRKLRSRVGRIYREVERQLDQVPQQPRQKLAQLLGATKRILTQRPKDKKKLYALHAPEVECIAKGKARIPYEFGVKVSVATTLAEGLVVGARSMPGYPYDGHTLDEALEQTEILSEVKPEQAFVDRGFKGVTVDGVQIWISGQKRGVTRALRAMIKRRSAIEPTIGHTTQCMPSCAAPATMCV
jgi:IS5 family transposase